MPVAHERAVQTVTVLTKQRTLPLQPRGCHGAARARCAPSAPTRRVGRTSAGRQDERECVETWSVPALPWRLHPYDQQQARAPGSFAVPWLHCCSCNWSRARIGPSCRSHRRRCHSAHQQLVAPHASRPLPPSVYLALPRSAAGVAALAATAVAVLRHRHCLRRRRRRRRRRHCRRRHPRRPA
jgi:hypothetical protein